jgi:hypothetical protein
VEKNRVMRYHFVLVVDAKLSWSIFCIKGAESEKPVEMYKGRFVSEKSELKRLVGAYVVDGRLIVIFDGFSVFYLNFPKELEPGKFLMNREFIPYGEEPAY